MDMLDTMWDGIVIPEADCGGMMDGDASFDYTNISPEGPLLSADVIATRVRLSNGVTINEPDPARPMSDRQFLVSMDVAGKGKRKVDDIPTFMENDYYAIHGCVPRCALSGRYPVEPLCLSSGHTEADLGVGSCSSLGSVVNDGAMLYVFTDWRLLLLLTAGLMLYMLTHPLLMNLKCTFLYPLIVTSLLSDHNQPATRVRVLSHVQPGSFTTTSQSPYNRSWPRQTRRQTRSTVHVPTSDAIEQVMKPMKMCVQDSKVIDRPEDGYGLQY